MWVLLAQPLGKKEKETINQGQKNLTTLVVAQYGPTPKQNWLGKCRTPNERILIEKYECKCKDELHSRERYWIDELKPELNKVIPKQTQKEWRETPDPPGGITYRKQYLQREDLKEKARPC